MCARTWVLVVVAILLTGCGGSSPTASSATTAPSTDAATPVNAGSLRVQIRYDGAPQKARKAVPAATAAVAVWLVDAESGLLRVPARVVPRTAGDLQVIVLDDVPAGVHRLVLQFLDAAKAPLGYCLRAVDVGTSDAALVEVDDFVDLEQLTVNPAPAEVALSTSLPLTVRGRFSDGSQGPVTGAVVWISDDAAIASVGRGAFEAGVVRGLKAGSTTVRARLGTVEGLSTVHVKPKGLSRLTISPATLHLALGLTQDFSASGVFVDGSTQDLTRSVTWASVTPSVAAVDAAGHATTSTAGATEVTATLADLRATATLTVDPHALVALQVLPASVSMRDLLDTTPLRVTATYTDGTRDDVTSLAVWAVGDSALAVAPGGVLRGLGRSGSSVVHVSLGGVSSSASVTLTESVVVGDPSACSFLQFGDFAASDLARGFEGDRTNRVAYALRVTVDAQGRIYVADMGHCRIFRVDDMTGKNFVAFGTPGSGPGQFNGPLGIRVDSQNRIYVADYANFRVVRIDDMQGNGWTTLGHFGSGVNEFHEIWGLFLDAADRLYISDAGNNRVVRVDDMTGAHWAELGGFAGQDEIYVDASNRLYVADWGHGALLRVDDMLGNGRVSYGGLNGVDSIALDRQQRIVVSEVVNSRLLRIDDMTGANLATFGTYGSGVNQFRNCWGIVFDALDRLYVSDGSNCRVVRIDDFSGAGFTTYGSLSPLDVAVSGAAVDSRGRVYFSDYNDGSVVRADDRQGTNLVRFKPTGALEMAFVSGVAIDSHDRIYIADSGHDRLLRIDDMSGANAVTFGSSGFGVNQFSWPGSLFIDASDRVYVTDESRLIRFDDMSGANWTEFGGGGQLGAPVGACVDAGGRLYVADSDNRRLVRMDDMSGTNLSYFPSPDNMIPGYVTLDALGRIYFSGIADDPVATPHAVFRMDDFAGTNLQRMNRDLAAPGALLVR